MKLNKLSSIILAETCRHHHLFDFDNPTKAHLIRTAIILAVATKTMQTAILDENISINVRLQNMNRLVERMGSFFIYVEYGYQNARIYNLDNIEKITLSEISRLGLTAA